MADARSPAAAPSRWSGSAWTFFRQDGSTSLAPGGTLGGSQAGGRVAYRINDDPLRPLALTGRFYTPIDDLDAAEVAAGVEWQPFAKLPVRLLAERRQAIGEEGRSAFSLLAYGGVSELPVAGPVLLDAYGQVGVVGLRSRDAFVDGSVRLGVPIGRRIRIGAGAWGAAQPGLSRIDVGPHASIRLPIRDASVTLIADWRFRIAGAARPDSGPAVTLATDF